MTIIGIKLEEMLFLQNKKNRKVSDGGMHDLPVIGGLILHLQSQL